MRPLMPLSNIQKIFDYWGLENNSLLTQRKTYDFLKCLRYSIMDVLVMASHGMLMRVEKCDDGKLLCAKIQANKITKKEYPGDFNVRFYHVRRNQYY
ncbi:unnamed protein product [Nippostrongylus brasiliensis]|uniref:DNA-directed RNA polymerase n=1 Tax=Nippostrongylus brasiliensis TaxID=27835 RepID=A0A0N4XMX1_NIPBR|nr:unnamed protein product [Nippostrongylus brasiliensis]